MTSFSRVATGFALVLLALGASLSTRAASDNPVPQPGDVVAGPSASGSGAQFRFIIATGSVGFDIPGNWPTVAMQPRPPIAVAAFQIPNPADAGSSDSTNVAVTVFDLADAKGRTARSNVGRSYGPNPPTTSEYHGWTVYRQEAVQGSTTYTLLDAARNFPALNAAAAMRLAWPHLASNSENYDATMDTLYRSMLDSVSTAPGTYSPGPREVVRRLQPETH